MSKYYIYQDTKRCIGCFSCESHCKTKNNLPIGPRLTQIIPVGPKKLNNLPRMSYVFMPCFHCQEPWCVAACPTGAMQKKAQGRHRLCRRRTLCRLQSLYYGLPMGNSPVEPGNG